MRGHAFDICALVGLNDCLWVRLISFTTRNQLGFFLCIEQKHELEANQVALFLDAYQCTF